MNDIFLDHISKAYDGTPVFTDFSCRLAAGRTTALLGPSGSGKTTLLYLLMGLLSPDQGRMTGMPSSISVVFQEDRLSEEMTVERNLRLVTGRHCRSEELTVLLSELGIEDTLSQRVSTLSGGMKRRVALARALLAPYEVLLLDEPLKGLDEDTKQQVLVALARHTAGKTVILVTHDRSEAEFLHASMLEL